MSDTNSCPCGSEMKLTDCCLPLIQQSKLADTAETLLRARYTAFTQGEVDFILSTHHSRTLKDTSREEVEEWSKGSEWLGLKIVQIDAGQKKDEKGTILFSAKYSAEGKTHEHWEKSFFEKEKGQWKFLDAQGIQIGTLRRTEPKIGRNAPCSCGSGKKYKKCCSAA